MDDRVEMEDFDENSEEIDANEDALSSEENFYDKTSYTIMFGPDKCGEDYKLHFIFRHKHPKTGVFEEKHAKPPDVDLKKFFTDRKTHLYTLVINPDDTFEVLIDQTVVNKGSLLEDVVPPINPPKEIEDPSDKKPDDWDERVKIPDPSAVKPEDWDESEPAQIEDSSVVKPDGWLDDEPKFIPDPNAEKPEDWNEDMDGEWEAPRISNPACRIGCELWSMTSDIYFDNFIICSEKEVADRWAADGWGVKIMAENANEKKYEDAEFKKTDICKQQTKGALEQEVKEEKAALEKPVDLEEEKKESDGEILEKEEEGEPEEKSDEEIEIIEGREEGNKSNKSGSEDEMKEADESTGSGDGPVKSVRKRRVRKE
ncbi:calmegin-like isoform 2 [Camelus ferus]|nr:calmegin-like isoform 2 [Camelus ferus]